MSPRTKVQRSSFSGPSMLLVEPSARLSIRVTSLAPAASSCSARCEPSRLAPPTTTNLFPEMTGIAESPVRRDGTGRLTPCPRRTGDGRSSVIGERLHGCWVRGRVLRLAEVHVDGLLVKEALHVLGAALPAISAHLAPPEADRGIRSTVGVDPNGAGLDALGHRVRGRQALGPD